MQNRPRLLGLIVVVVVIVAVGGAFFVIRQVNAQNTQNKTMRSVVESLIVRQKADKNFVFDIETNYGVYNSEVAFDITNSDTNITEIGDDHLCVLGKKQTTDTIFCYPYNSIVITYAK